MTKRKPDTYPLAFILLSLLAFGLFWVCAFFIIPALFPSPSAGLTKQDIYTKTEAANSDPLITTVPQLADIIAGPIITGSDPMLGPNNAPVTITVYTDFTCWYCGQTIALARRVQAEFAAAVRLVHKDFPNPSKAYASYQAAIAGRCAQRQNKFWEFSERLYENYDTLNRDTFDTIAAALDLNAGSFAACLDGRAAAPVITDINDTISEANALGIVGVPLVYVNATELPAELTYEELKAAVERELNFELWNNY